MVPVLNRVGKHRSQQDKCPAQLNPDEQKRDSGKGAVNGIVFCYTDLQNNVSPLDDEPENRGEYSSAEGGDGFYPDMRKEEIHHHQGQSDKGKWQQLEQHLNSPF